MKLKFFSQVSLISIITTLMMAKVSIAKPDLLFAEREDVRDHLGETRDNREDRFDEREDVRDHLEEIKDARKDRDDSFSPGDPPPPTVLFPERS